MHDKKSVLIIDDDTVISDVLSDILQSEGCEVICCDNGATALDLSKEKCFDIIITDYRMPGMNGVEITRALRSRCGNSFIIGFSAEYKEKAFLEAGADVFFKKPVSFKEIVTLICRK